MNRETNIIGKDYKTTISLLFAYYRHEYFRELDFGEKIKDGDVYVLCNGAVCRATDTGSGIYGEDHFPHFRDTKKEVTK